MKKLTYLVSAIAAGLFSSAHADISVSGSASVAYQAAGSDTNLHNGGAISFGLSTTTDSGLAVSTSAGMTLSTTSATGGSVTGWDNITFATGGVTLTVGNDVGVPDGTGDVGGLVGDVAAVNNQGMNSTVGLTDDEGTGVSLSTSLGGAALSLAYVADSAPGATGDIDGATGTGSGVSISTTVGSVAVSASYTSHSDTGVDDTETGISASYASSMGTLTAGYETSTGANDGNGFGVAYSMSLDSATSLGIGYSSMDVNSESARQTDVTISRSLGGGMSVFAEMRSVSGDTGATGEASTMALGTSVSF
jgi:hypothetical protein